jgi:hypothetical protein
MTLRELIIAELSRPGTPVQGLSEPVLAHRTGYPLSAVARELAAMDLAGLARPDSWIPWHLIRQEDT